MSYSCLPTPDRNQSALSDLQRRVRQLEKNLAGFQEITGVCTTGGQFIVDVIGLVYDPESGTYLLSFLSEPGAFYQVQQSSDAITWTPVENFYPAAADPDIITTWTSGVFAIDTTIWFRVRKNPPVRLPCTPPANPCPDILPQVIV